jgi:reactive intermediate/imine deaminase
MSSTSFRALSGFFLSAVAAMCMTPSSEAAPRQAVNFLNQSSTAAPFSEAVQVGRQLYLSGQLGLIPGQGVLAAGGLLPETRQALANTKASLERYGYSMRDVVKCTVFLVDMADFAVVNREYLSAFSKPYPVRTLVAVRGLAFGARVELDCIAAK